MQNLAFKNFAFRTAGRAGSEGAEGKQVGAIAPQPFEAR